MAGGVAADLRSPWPKGSDGIILLQSNSTDFIASQTNKVFDVLTVPFACKPIYAETVSQAMAITNGITLSVIDDTGTPKEMITDAAAAAITAGASAITALAVVKSVIFYAGALMKFTYISGASDTSVNTIVRLWVKPLY